MEIIIKNSTMKFKSQRVMETYTVTYSNCDRKGFYQASNGNFTSVNPKVATRDKLLIPSDATEIIANLFNQQDKVAIVFWDSSKNILSYLVAPTGGTETSITIPSGAKYVSFSSYSNDITSDSTYMQYYIKM